MGSKDEIIDAEAHELPPEGEGVNLPVVSPSHSTALVARDEIDVSELMGQSRIIEEAMRLAMREDVHYGKIPGVNKPTLLKPGAEKLLVLFRLAPSYISEKVWHDDGHLTVMSKCVLTHIPTGLVIAEGEGLCTTKESRYAWRRGERTCPECGEATVREGRAREGRPGNWYCWKKSGVSNGCGATWDLESEQGQIFKAMETGRVPNPDLADAYNTVLKMSDKRALIASILNGLAASDVFTQDIGDDGSDRSESRGSESRGSANADWDDGKPAVITNPQSNVFRPAFDLAQGAPLGWDKIGELIARLDPNLTAWVTEAIDALYGCKVSEITDEDVRAQAGRRVANVLTRIRDEVYKDGDFPLAGPDEYRPLFAWAFEGHALNGPDSPKSQTVAEEVADNGGLLGPMPTPVDDDIPF